MTDHVFISYSTADALDFATRLANELDGGYPPIPVWFDKRNLRPGMEWDIQIDDGLKSCKLVLFVMTKDSTNEKSVCKQEWSRALSYKKLVIPLLLQQNVNTPFRLGDRQRIDFTRDFQAGVAQLRRHIAWLDSPEGILQDYKDRLADAERDLQRAKDEDKPRIQADIEELNKQIETQQKIVADPEAAKKQTEQNIQTGLERERQPEKPIAEKTSTKFINPPPGIAPNYFQDRLIETKQVVDFLKNDSQRLMTIVGRAGVGKTAMICRLLKSLESGQLPDGLGEMKVDGIVYLSETGSHRINFANLFADLNKLLPAESTNALEAIYKNPQTSTAVKMSSLLDQFPAGKVVLLLDNLEPLINVETFGIGDAELDECLCAFLHGTHNAVKIILTTRIAPRGLNLCEPGRQRVLILDEGLESPYAENILREMDADGKLGLKNAPAAVLAHAREHTRGYPRALEALFAILASDRYTSLEEILNTAENYLPENVVQSLVGEAFNRLDTNAQKVMQALAVYNRPVTPAAVDYLLAPHIPAIDSATILQRLANMHFARKESGRFYLHPVDREFAFGLIGNDEGGIGNSDSPDALIPHSLFTQHDLLTRAADYFAQARKPRTEWKKLEDLSAQLAEFELRCAAGDYDTAANVLTEIDFEYLLLWGHYRLTIDLHGKLQEKIKDLSLARISIGNLGQALSSLGKLKEAVFNYERALAMAREAKNRHAEGVWLGNLGYAYADLGDIQKAIEFHRQALTIVQKIGDRESEGKLFGYLANDYANLGDIRKAIEYHEQALVIAREIGDRKSEGIELGNLGNSYGKLGDMNKAIELHEKALVISRDIGNRSGEAIHLENIGHELLNLAEYKKSEVISHHAIEIADEISFFMIQNWARLDLAHAHLFQNNLGAAQSIIEEIFQYDSPENNHKVSALYGIIALRQGDMGTARQAFTRAITQADAILVKTPELYDALDVKWLALCGRIVSGEWEVESDKANEVITDIVDIFRTARKIVPYSGVVKSMLMLFDELAKCDGDEILKGMREVIAEKL